MNQKIVQKTLQQSKETYSKIAQEFSETRKYNWGDTKEMIKLLKNNCHVLDLGCGNGRLFELIKEKNCNYVGIDNQLEFINNAREKYPEAKFIVEGVESWKAKPDAYDAVFTIAVLHHIPSKKLQIEILKKIYKTLRNKGKLFITVWNLYQPKYKKFLHKAFFSKLLGSNKLGINDCMIPWKNSNGEIVAYRFVHAYTKNELEKLVQAAGFIIEEIYYSQKGKKTDKKHGYNLCVVARAIKK